jgi:glycosyltransferase involved in cell wall biosynthesis
MRIVHLAKYHSPLYGGMESHVETLASKQAKLGAKVAILCINSFDRNSKLSRRTKTEISFNEEGIQIIKVGRLFSFLKVDFCPSLIFYILYFSKLSDTVFHVHTPNPTMLFALVLTGKFRNLVVTHHSDAIKQKFLKYIFRPIEHLVYSQASIILTTSKNYQYGSKFLRLYKDKLGVLPLGLDTSVFANPSSTIEAKSQELKAEYGDIIWLSVGRLVYYKSYHIALTALQYVPGKLLIVGTGPLKAKLQKLAHQLNVADRVIWLGKTSESDLVAAYHAATALWFPSNVRSEAFGIVQVEAMASGCPVLNCQIPGSGVPWVCRDQKEGLTSPINHPKVFAAAAQRLLTEPGLRERLSLGAKQRSEQFGDVLMAQRSLAIYHRVLPTDQVRSGVILTPDFSSDFSK